MQILGHFSDVGAARGEPLVLLLPGPPGHGKTFAATSLALALVSEDDILNIACRFAAARPGKLMGKDGAGRGYKRGRGTLGGPGELGDSWLKVWWRRQCFRVGVCMCMCTC